MLNQWINVTGYNDDGQYYIPGANCNSLIEAIKVKRREGTFIYDVQALYHDRWYAGKLAYSDTFIADFKGDWIAAIAEQAIEWIMILDRG